MVRNHGRDLTCVIFVKFKNGEAKKLMETN